MARKKLNWLEKRVIPGQLDYAGRIFEQFAGLVRGRVLDFGCGVGATMECMRTRSGARPVGVDIAHNNLFQNPFVRFDGNVLPFADSTFDLVTEIFVLHHSPVLERNFAEMVRVAKDQLVLVEDVWTDKRNRRYLVRNHVIFDAFMVFLTWLGLAEWKTDFRYYFRDREGWLELFRRHGLHVIEDRELHLYPRDRVLHRLFVVAKHPPAAAAEPAESRERA